MKQKLTLTTLAALAGFAGASFGQTTFVFDDGSSTGAAGLALEAFSDGVDAASMGLNTSGTYSQEGITLTAGTDFGDFNLTNSGFGPDQPGSVDDSDNFDSDNGNESMVFELDTAGTFNSIDFALLDDSPETAVLAFSGGNTYNLYNGAGSTIAVSGFDEFTGIDESFTAGQQITLTVNNGSFTLESFTVTAVPEPSAFGLIAGMLGFTWIMLRRRR